MSLSPDLCNLLVFDYASVHLPHSRVAVVVVVVVVVVCAFFPLCLTINSSSLPFPSLLDHFSGENNKRGKTWIGLSSSDVTNCVVFREKSILSRVATFDFCVHFPSCILDKMLIFGIKVSTSKTHCNVKNTRINGVLQLGSGFVLIKSSTL